MSISLSILASGSAGNCSVCDPAGGHADRLRHRPKNGRGRMKGLGIGIGEVGAICLTHLDRDHFNPNWAATIIRQGIPLFCHEDRTTNWPVSPAGRAEFVRLIRPFNGKTFFPARGFDSPRFDLEHDQAWFARIRHRRIWRHGSDMRRIWARKSARNSCGDFSGVDVLAIESNYDPQMQMSSDRPGVFEARIMGGPGPSFQQERLKAVRQILDQSQVGGGGCRNISFCFTAAGSAIARRFFANCSASTRRMQDRLVLAEQDRATQWLCAQ